MVTVGFSSTLPITSQNGIAVRIDRQHEAGDVAATVMPWACRVAVRLPVRVLRRALDRGRSSQHSHQIDEGEDADPDHVEEVPEHRQAHEPAPVRGDQPVLAHLRPSA